MLRLDHVLIRFPERANEIRALCLGDPHFRSICEDLSLACESLSQGGQLDGATASASVIELRAVRGELEIELIQYLNGRRTDP